MKAPIRTCIAIIGALGFVGLITSALLGIWTGDERWLSTALVALAITFVGSLTAAGYPGGNK